MSLDTPPVTQLEYDQSVMKDIKEHLHFPRALGDLKLGYVEYISDQTENEVPGSGDECASCSELISDQTGVFFHMGNSIHYRDSRECQAKFHTGCLFHSIKRERDYEVLVCPACIEEIQLPPRAKLREALDPAKTYYDTIMRCLAHLLSTQGGLVQNGSEVATPATNPPMTNNLTLDLSAEHSVEASRSSLDVDRMVNQIGILATTDFHGLMRDFFAGNKDRDQTSAEIEVCVLTRYAELRERSSLSD